MREKNKFWAGLATGLVLSIMITAMVGMGLYIKQRIFPADGQSGVLQTATQGADQKNLANADTMQKLDVLQEAVSKYYLEEADTDKLEEGIYRGVIDGLGDPYSTYYSAQELVSIQESAKGIYFGIGAYMGMDLETGLARISSIIPETPAEESGLQAGDYIYKIDGETAEGLDTTEVVSKIKGEAGTKVLLTIIRDNGKDILDISVERREIKNQTVNMEMLENGLAYIKILEFDEVTIDQFREAYAMAKGSDMKGLLLDLRDNPGGNLTAVTEICRMILPKGMIVYTEDKYGERDEYTCDGENVIQVPMVVLVNGNSASASEIMAGAIKDYGVGTLLGTNTFGKGIVQRIIALSDESAVKLTVSHYFTPNGNNIHGVGIKPDIEVEADIESWVEKGYDNQFEEGKKVLTERINN